MKIHNKMILRLKKQWFVKGALESKRGRTTIESDPRSERPNSATTPNIVLQIPFMVLEGQRLIVDDIF